ncbi:MAG: DUF4070 domain-containing protein [Candidatus Theseobacter exili]|nr:DUF4070 domain-containing protein [Candidatus Theseobacter exili]
MKILFVYPENPDTFWSFKHAVKFISKKAVHPPLGLLTVAAMLPEKWEKKLVDMNVAFLKDRDIEWADYVFISAMVVQKESVKRLITRCNDLGTGIVAGGPLFTSSYKDFKGVDHFLLNEAELTIPVFLKDFYNNELKYVYSSDKFAPIGNTPVPLWDLIDMKKYVSMNIQYSRGCPFNCDFCDITTLFGRNVRTKSKKQVISELDKLYSMGWKGNVFFVDDNFIGNKSEIKKEILPAIVKWMSRMKYPFVFSTEVSINMADDEELMKLMYKAGFECVFIGIETPDDKSLAECGKFQNKNRNMVDSVRKIQQFGFEVAGGFIVGFDNDSHSIFDRQINLIQKSGIVTAMVGLLNAPKQSRLYQRLINENRITQDPSGSNTDFTINFIPKMDYSKLISGYKKIINGIYSAEPYYKRIRNYLINKQHIKRRSNFKIGYLKALFRSIFFLGIRDRERVHFWKLIFWSLFRSPQLLPEAITYAIYGFHFRKIFKDQLS